MLKNIMHKTKQLNLDVLGRNVINICANCEYLNIPDPTVINLCEESVFFNATYHSYHSSIDMIVNFVN